MIISLIFKNIKNSFAEHTKVYMLMVFSQLIAIISVFFVYGIFSSYSSKLQELNIDSYKISADFSDVEMAELKESLTEILHEIEVNLDFIFVAGISDDSMLTMHGKYYNGAFHVAEQLKNMDVEAGRTISDEDVVNANKVAFGTGFGEVGSKVNIAGTEFEVIGVDGDKSVNLKCIPITACPDSVEIMMITFNFSSLPTQDEYLLIRNELKRVMGNKVTVDEFELKDEEELISIRSIITISVSIGTVSALNTCLLYGYIISRRRKQMAVYGIIGATKKLRLIINLSEVMFINLILELIGVLIFRFTLQELISEIYESSVIMYGIKSYVIMIAAYTMCILFITFIMLKITNNDRLINMLRRSVDD